MSDINTLPPLREVIRAHDLRAEKKLGQNFLLDLNLTQKIARAAGDLSGCAVFEIGPGPGGLTRALLLEGAERLTAIEFDPRAVLALEDLKAAAEGRLTVLQQDALQTDLLALAGDRPAAVVANLPYNIATPLLIGWLRQIRRRPQAYRSLTLMFQKEVVQRIAAGPGGKEYGRLSVLCQWLCRAQAKFDIPPAAFTPPPKVTSSVVHLIPRPPEPDAPRFESVEAVTAAAFGQRRKMIRSSLKDYAAEMEELGLDPQSRAENLTVAQFVALARLKDRR